MIVKVLIEGYAKEIDGIEYASSSTTFIDDGTFKVIVDPGSNRELLLNRLKDINIDISDINIVILTHTHLDHSLLAGIFINASIYDNSAFSRLDSSIREHNSKIGESISIINTPGHDRFHASVVIKNTDKGVIVLAGDIFWWLDEEEALTDINSLLNKVDPYVKNEKELLESRKQVLEIADYIIPGHGKSFYIKKD